MGNSLQKGNKDIYYHEWLKRLIKRNALVGQILGLDSSDYDSSLWTQELQDYYASMNNGLSFDYQNLINALQQLEVSSIIPLSKTVWVNLDLTASDINSRRFKTYDEAITWIQENGGTLGSDNVWQVICPPLMDTVTLYDFIIVTAELVLNVINNRTQTGGDMDVFTYIGEYDVNGNFSSIMNNYVNTITNSTSNICEVKLVNTTIESILNTEFLEITAFKSQIFNLNVTILNRIRLINCTVAGSIHVLDSAVDGSIYLENTLIFKDYGTSTLTIDAGNLITRNCTVGEVIINGGTWTNEGNTLDSRAFSNNLTTACTDTQLLAEAVDQLILGSTTIPLSNTVWVNADLAEDDVDNRIFKSYANAADWINDNGGTLSFTNMWQVNCPALMDEITLYDYIIVNDEVEKASKKVSNIIDAERNRAVRTFFIVNEICRNGTCEE